MKKLLLAFALCALSCPAIAADPQESAYARVLRTNTLRCGYASWEPGVIKDAGTGQMKGLFVDLTDAAMRLAGLKVEWTAEVDWGQIPAALRAGKIDAFCAGMANDAARAKQLAYSIPLSYWSFDVITRADDDRFPKDRPVTLDDLDKPAFAMSYSEGDVLETIKQTELPAVKSVALPPLGTPADNLMNVLNKKTDFVVFPRVMIQGYEKANGGGKLRLLKMATPLRVYGNVIAVDIQERDLKNLLDASVTELLNASAYDRIMTPYEKEYPGAFLRPKRAYDLTP